jgi:hypothetical protein
MPLTPPDIFETILLAGSALGYIAAARTTQKAVSLLLRFVYQAVA